MRPDPFDEYDAGLIGNLHQNSVAVSFHVKNHSVVLQKISCAVSVLDVLTCSPLRAVHLGQPRLHWFASLSVPFDELVDLVLADQRHYAVLFAKASAKPFTPKMGI